MEKFDKITSPSTVKRFEVLSSGEMCKFAALPTDSVGESVLINQCSTARSK